MASGIPLDQVIPWGRTFDEYVSMFDLCERLLERRIVGVGDGPASFCAEHTARGGEVVAIDPLYAHRPDAIRARIEEVCEEVMSAIRDHRDGYHWDRFQEPADLERARMEAMARFLDHFVHAPQHYKVGSLPSLPLDDDSAHVALCSHFLFTYAHLLDEEFHFASIIEMLRIAQEVRIFPIITTEGQVPSWFDSLVAHLEEDGFLPEVIPVSYRFQRGAEAMLRVYR